MSKTVKTKRLKTRKEIIDKLKAKGWKLRNRLHTGEIWKKGDEVVFYDKALREVFPF